MGGHWVALSSSRRLTRRVEDLVVEHREVEREAQADGVRGRQVLRRRGLGRRVGVEGCLRGLLAGVAGLGTEISTIIKKTTTTSKCRGGHGNMGHYFE